MTIESCGPERTWSGALLVALPVAGLTSFGILAATVGFPQLLSAPAAVALGIVAAHPAAITVGFVLYSVAAGARLPLAIILHRHLGWRAEPWTVLATVLGGLSAVLHVIGLLRWPTATAYLATVFTDPASTTAAREYAVQSYVLLDHLLSTLLIDRLTYLCLAVWLAAVAGGLHRRGDITASWRLVGWVIAAGSCLTLLQPAVGDVYQVFVFATYPWLLVTGILVLRRSGRRLAHQSPAR